ncbi:MAG: septum formation initiator family protein [Candidatus Margulisiibacteriota bacterium]
MFKHTPVLYVIGLVVLYLLYSNIKIGYYNVKYSFEIRQLNKKIAHEKAVQRQLLWQLKEVKSEPFIEEKARTILGLIKKGEVAYQVVDSKYDRNNSKY